MSISSLLNRVQELRVYGCNFGRQKSMHAKQQALQYLTFKLLFGRMIDGVAEMEEEEKEEETMK